MANNSQNYRSARGAAPQAGDNNNGFKPADAFLNIGINGKKLVGVPLDGDKAEHAQLMAWLQPEGDNDEHTAELRKARLEKLLNSLTISYQPVSKEPKKFDLPD